MDISFKERCVWVSFLVTLWIFGDYFFNLLGLSDLPAEQGKESALDLLGRAVLFVTILEIVFHSIIAATDRKEAEMGGDERDKSIAQRANQYGYYVLSTGVIFVVGRMMLVEAFPRFADENSSIYVPMLTAHILLFSFILSELIRFGAQIWFYRRGY